MPPEVESVLDRVKPALAQGAERSAGGQKVAYFAHDVFDPAIERRVRMLEIGGARVLVFGFRRRAEVRRFVSAAPVIDLGQTEDAKLAARGARVAQVILQTPAIRARTSQCDVLLARNLEMLAIAGSARRPGQRLVYECLDIHRSMVGGGVKAQAMRALERHWLRTTDLVIVSSPAFAAVHFARQGRSDRLMLVENKLLPDAAPAHERIHRSRSDQVWRIGWFGVLRCRRSLEALAKAAKEMNGALEVILRGRPAYHEFDDFADTVRRSPYLRFDGAYGPQEVADMYATIDYCWGVDCFDEGANSDWLLPNRLYEAMRHNTPIIARAGAELARYVEAKGCGVVLDRELQGLPALFQGLPSDRPQLSPQPETASIHTQDDCITVCRFIARGL